MHDSQIVVEETTRRNMSVSFTSGTNWSNANLPTIDADHPAAAKELDVVERGPAPAAPRAAAPCRGSTCDAQPVESAAARAPRRGPRADARRRRSPPGSWDDGAGRRARRRLGRRPHRAGDATRPLDWTAPDDGDWRLFTFWMHGTGQTASPSASVNYTVNYLDPDGAQAVIDYWDSVVLTPELRAQIARNPRAQMYMDSLELSTYGRRRPVLGPDRRARSSGPPRLRHHAVAAVPHPQRAADGGGDDATTTSRTAAHAATVEKVRFDYVAHAHRPLHREHAAAVRGVPARRAASTLRSEISYGLPFELTRPGPEVDGIETESLEFASQIDAYRLLAGPAHLFGKQYSSETGRDHPQPHPRPPLLRPDHRHPARRRHHQDGAARLGQHRRRGGRHRSGRATRACGRCSPSGSTPASRRRSSTRCGPPRSGRFQCVLRQGRPRDRRRHPAHRPLHRQHVRASAWSTRTAGGCPTRRSTAAAGCGTGENHWWQDLGMQDAGWTYEFFDGSLLLRDDVIVRRRAGPAGRAPATRR